MRERSRTRQQGSGDQTKNRELATFVIRIAAFVCTLVPLAALALPWVVMDGTEETVSGVGAVALLLPPMGEYLYAISPLQASIVTMSPALVALLAIITSHNYRKRQSVFWAPPAMLAVAAVIVFGATDLVAGVAPGLVLVMAVAVLLTLHQIAIRMQVFLRRKMKMPQVYRALAVATGMGNYRWSER